MVKPSFDVIGYRERLGLTQFELGALMGLADPQAVVAAWESHQRAAGARRHGPSSSSVAYMKYLERIWRAAHAGLRRRHVFRPLLPDKLWHRTPPRLSRSG